ncbi:MAG: 50S ribosomal protein L21 [Rhodospirillaceae bacterium TMED8]|nr:50S ribosomal protein L21 [Magnetovibrio sp.]MAH85001.1 50S ribosomal protein L21 [Magnetovibrio sp.]OUT49292.1 MAG: 50S ribosomal protein L21 [Rhodospirillaceae bacterium TMED8]OUT50536.1 MAG: 50S ribosomal protein L21 [Rhodospirillaceae bacterium TMED8]|tara:strand:+ start:133 stop:660 length:528 start_codon:yes stop_codon:yes gene_type:complete
MFAVIKSGGKQYRVSKDDIITVEKLIGAPGETIQLDRVLMLGENGSSPTLGGPLVDKAAVFAEVVEQSRADKIIVFKKQRRQNHRRKNGHRQQQTVLRIIEVSPTGTVTKVVAKKTEPKEKATKKKALPKKARAHEKTEVKAKKPGTKVKAIPTEISLAEKKKTSSKKASADKKE